MDIDTTIKGFLFGLDLVGALAFALSGASAALRKGLDAFGVLFRSIVVATFGALRGIFCEGLFRQLFWPVLQPTPGTRL